MPSGKLDGKTRILILLVLGISLISTINISAQEFPDDLTGDYLGQPKPGILPELFAPDIITTDTSEGCSGWGKNMEYFIFQRWIDGKSVLYIMHQSDAKWTKPERIVFADQYQIGDFTIAPDGKTLIYVSRIAIDEIGTEGEGGNIWITKKTGNDWTNPYYLKDPVNTKYHDSYPSLAANKNLYFFSRRPGGHGKSDLYFAEYMDGGYKSTINLGQDLNTFEHEWDTYIAPDESYMIYCSMKPDGFGEDDLYVTFRLSEGSWGLPIHLGTKINSEKSENRPYVSPDEKYLFYTSNKRGNRDIYWVSMKVIEELK